MREIKFRVWDNETNKFWHEGRNIALVSLVPDNLVNDDSTVLEQYTGFKDLDGGEIYEGDVLLDVDDGIIIGVVKFVDGSWEVAGDLLLDVHCNQIIGNIHENPELLEVEE